MFSTSAQAAIKACPAVQHVQTYLRDEGEPLKGFKRIHTDDALENAKSYAVDLDEAYGHGCSTYELEIASRLIERVREIWGVEIYIVDRRSKPGLVWSDGTPAKVWSTPDATLYTGSDLNDVLYEDRCLFLDCTAKLDIMIHEIAHMLVASTDGDRLDRVNFGTCRSRYLSSHPGVFGFNRSTDSHEEDALDAQVSLLLTMKWPDAKRIASLLCVDVLAPDSEEVKSWVRSWEVLLGTDIDTFRNSCFNTSNPDVRDTP